MAVSTVQGTAAFSAQPAPLASCVPPAPSAPAQTGHAGRLAAIKGRVDRDFFTNCYHYPACGFVINWPPGPEPNL